MFVSPPVRVDDMCISIGFDAHENNPLFAFIIMQKLEHAMNYEKSLDEFAGTIDLFPNEQNLDLDKSIDKNFITA